MKRYVPLGLALGMTVVCVAVNLPGAWYGGSADAPELLVTLLYIAAWAVCTATARTKMSRCFGWSFALLTLLGGVWGVACRISGFGFVLSALITCFASVPFYGLRMVVGWTGLYAVAAVLGAVWTGCLVKAGTQLRRKNADL